MPIAIKALANGQLSTTQATLYTVPASKTAITKNMRFVNTSDSTAYTIKIYYKRSGQTARLILPKDLSIAPKNLVIDDQEVTMEAGDEIRGEASANTVIDYVISGIERDV
jgi:hypothetical protein